ncbi:hypothetical protein Q3G72_026176 [Acer saccharum]|nr:hypothetical protein Q3G72_026176 [Acer saccharum]
MDGSREGAGERSDSRRPGSLDSHKVDQASSAAATKKRPMDALALAIKDRPTSEEDMCVDGPRVGLGGFEGRESTINRREKLACSHHQPKPNPDK